MLRQITTDRCGYLTVGFFIAGVLFLSLAGTGWAIQCYQCHGTASPADYRPVDAPFRNRTTGGFPGSHRTHMAPGATVTNCTPCHGGRVASYTTSHRDGFINITSNINGSPATGAYSRGTSFAQSANPTLGTCSGVNCHFESATPTWGATPLAAPTDCNKCHGAAPADGSHPATSGSGKKHGDYYGTTTGSCVKCHPDHTAEGAPFAHATSAGHRGLAVQFTAAPNSGAGSYGGTVGYPNYLPSQAPPRNGTCSGLYCHSPGNKASAFNAPNTVATWGGSLTCTGCHKATVDYMNTGSHYAHVFGGGTTYSQIKCSVCHAATASGNTAIADVTRHVDYQVEIAFANSSSAANGSYNGAVAKPATPSAKAPGSSYGSCQNVYCHSTGQADGGTWPPTYTTPTWGSATTGKCGTCHGTTGSDTHGGFPGLMIQRQISSGSHRKHLKTVYGITDSDMKCAICHAYDKSAFTSTSASCGTVCHVASQPLKHANYEINVNIANYFGATAGYNGSTRPGAGYSTCSSVYCHSNGLTASPTYTTPTWGNAASGACGTCHGVTAAAPPASTPHAKHVGSANPYRFACAECHNGKVQATANATTAPAFANSTSHVNKSRDVKFDPTNAFGTYSSAITTCRNLYCHSTGNTSVAAGNLPGAYGGSVYVRQGWTGSVTCNSCHGRSTSNGMPDYTNAGAAGSATSNSHAKHVQSSGISCGECHEKTTKNGTSIRTTVSPSYHVNGSRNVFFNLTGNNASGTYDSAQKKCSSTYCHGAGASLAWGGSTYCNSCHSANAGTTGGGGINNWGTTPVSAHKLHVEETTALPSKYSNYSTGNLSGSATAYRFGCASCHNPAQATHVSGYASSPYRAQVFFGYTAPGKKPTYTYTGAAGTTDNGFAWSNGNTACTSTYCHSNGAGGSGNTAVSWATTASSATNTRCKACHSYTTASGLLISTNKHAKHVDGTTYGFSCAKCHNATTTDGATIADKTKHVNKKKDVVWDGTNSDGSAYVNSSTACANIYCHSQGTTFAQPYTGAGKAPNTAVTWGGGQTLGCNGCHGNSNSYTTGTYRIAAPLYASGAPKGNAHQLHIDARATQGSAQPQCLNCHGKTTTTNTSIASYSRHVNEFYNISTAGTYKDGDNVTAAAGSLAAVTYTYNAAGSTCANVTCHPTGLGDANKAATVVAWNNRYNCTDCHKVDIANSTGYHHAMRNYSGSYAAYPTAVPQGDATTGTNSNSRRCTMCHVDHNIFSPMLNTNSAARANNLRTNITVAPVAGTASTYSNSDYVGTSGGSGGICISCHNSELTKSTTRILTETSSTKTVAIPFVSYSASAHEYAVASAMKGTDGGTFNANCSKCHNGRNGETAVFSQMTTTVHDRSVRRVYASLGTNLVDGNDENFCYRCHSKTADASPGGGPAKTVANKDYYKTAAMSSRAEGIFTAFQKTYKHNVAGYTGVHKPSPTNETAAYISANRHVECADCHNPHAATSANPIRGVTGLDPTTPAAGATPTYTVVTLNNPDHQYKLCFKCHTNWAGYGTGTNLAVEFNTNNVSYHWVENDKGAPKASTTYGNFNTTYVYKMMPRYNGYTNTQLRSVKMRCSDCHGSDGADGGVTVPEGPHGSSIAKILKVPAGSPYTTWNSTVKRLDGTVWCFNCHDPNFTSTGFSGEQANSHTYGSGYKHDRNCQYCHISVPHGNSTLKRLLNPSTFRTGINSINSGSYTQSNGHAQVIPGCT